MMTYFRSLDASYLISSRVLLSVFAAGFGSMTTLSLMHFGTLQAISFATMPGWVVGAYAGGALGCACLWLSTYFKTRSLVGGGRAVPTSKTRP